MTGVLYAALTDLKPRLGITDSSHDADLTDTLDVASRDIEQDTGRVFALDTSTSQRIYNPRNRVFYTSEGYKLLVDDIGDITGLVVEVGTPLGGWSAITDYETSPDAAFVRGWPIDALLRPFAMWTYWPLHRIRVTAKWGWPAVPVQIKQATLIRAQRLYKRRDSPEGVAGFNDLGVVRVGRYDPDYDRLVAPFKQAGFG